MLKNQFPSNLKYLLSYKGMSQQELANVIGKKRSAVGSYIRGESEPNIEILIKITDYFGISLNDLVFKNLTKYDFGTDDIDEAAEDSGSYKTKFELLKSLFGSDDSELEKKLDVIYENQIKILDMLDSSILLDLLKKEQEKVESKNSDSNN